MTQNQVEAPQGKKQLHEPESFCRSHSLSISGNSPTCIEEEGSLMIPPPNPGLRHLNCIVAEEFPKIHPTLRHFVWHLRNVRLRGCLLTFQSSSWIITPCVLSVTVLSTFWRLLVVCFVINHTQFLIPKYTKGRCNFTHWKSELLLCRYHRWCALVAYFPYLKEGKKCYKDTVPCGCVSWKLEPVDRFSRNLIWRLRHWKPLLHHVSEFSAITIKHIAVYVMQERHWLYLV
jgi:hypothetical protein